jgi:hypothetical protein
MLALLMPEEVRRVSSRRSLGVCFAYTPTFYQLFLLPARYAIIGSDPSGKPILLNECIALVSITDPILREVSRHRIKGFYFHV